MHAWRESGTDFVLVQKKKKKKKKKKKFCVSAELYAMFVPDHIFHARGRTKLNQNPACQELQIGLKKGPKMASEAILEHQI